MRGGGQVGPTNSRAGLMVDAQERETRMPINPDRNATPPPFIAMSGWLFHRPKATPANMHPDEWSGSSGRLLGIIEILTRHSKAAVTVSWMRSTVRVMGCRLASSCR